MLSKHFVLIVCVLAFLTGCDNTRLLDDNLEVKNYKWGYDDVKTFTVDVSDTASAYNLFVNVRHGFDFEWRNLWVNIRTQFPDSSVYNKRVNLLLSESTGEWNARCIGDNCFIQIPIQQQARFPMPGTYTFTITQDMRANPISHVKSIGMRIEKAAVAPQ